MGIGTVLAVVIDVNDLEVAEEFWSAVTDHEFRVAAGVTPA